MMWRMGFLTGRVLFWTALAAAGAVIPVSAVENTSFCLIYHTFGVKCITCGVSRAFFCMMHGQLARATQFNPLIWIIFPAYVLIYASDLRALVHALRGGVRYSIFERIWNRIFR